MKMVYISKIGLVRDFQFGLISFLLMISLLFEACGDITKSSTQDGRPNFLVIIADDAGWNDVGYHGSAIRTPNIDRLASEGAQLNRFYVFPTCSPTRASLLCGMPASRLGIIAPISGRSKTALPDSLVTLPKALKEYGYKTALVGKWHLGLRPETGPSAYGFDESYGFLHGQIDQYSHHYKNGDRSWHRNGTFIDEPGHSTDLITVEAIKQIRRFSQEEKPFYLQVAFSAPHTPLQEENKWRVPYDTIFSENSRRLFAAAMTHMDDGIGKILKALNEEDLMQKTVVLFMSDNGAQDGWFPNKNLYDGRFEACPVLGDNTPLKGWKTSVYEGAIRVPAVLYWYGKIKPQVCNTYIAVYDIFPTFLQMAGVDPDLYPSIEGVGLQKVICNNASLPLREIYIRGHLGAMVLTSRGDKLIWFDDPSLKLEAYNVNVDPEEQEDLSCNGQLTETLFPVLEKHISRESAFFDGEVQ